MEDSFVYEAKGPTLIIHLPKEFDHHNCRNLRYETDLLMAENYVSRIIFDFTRTRFMDSSGIGVLLNRYKQMKAGHTGFYGACPQVMRVLKVAGILGLTGRIHLNKIMLILVLVWKRQDRPYRKRRKYRQSRQERTGKM